jgi:hypothetical protein
VHYLHWTSLRREWGVQYSVLLDDDTEVDLVQADGSWKLCYSTSADDDWTVVDLGSCQNGGDLVIAADDSLAELVEWPELAQETPCRNGSQDRYVQQETPARSGLEPPTSWSLTPCIDLLQLPRRLGEKSRSWRDLSHTQRKCRKSLRCQWFLKPGRCRTAPGRR